ncbi:MAG TPA: hypothetical protein VMV46_04925 [Thermoanaerobaculia bacterium]|nr:hypothetical protein [Thermoanaerobaculia bacterium]
MNRRSDPRHPRGPGRGLAAMRAAVAALVVVAAWSAPPVGAQSVAASRAASELIGEGSVLVGAGAAEILSGGVELSVVGIRASARGVELALRPVARAASQGAEVSTAVTVELSQAAWEAAQDAARAAGVSLEASAAGAGAVSAVALGLGSALVVGDVVIAIVADERLAAMMGHGRHRCDAHGW